MKEVSDLGKDRRVGCLYIRHVFAISDRSGAVEGFSLVVAVLGCVAKPAQASA